MTGSDLDLPPLPPTPVEVDRHAEAWALARDVVWSVLALAYHSYQLSLWGDTAFSATFPSVYTLIEEGRGRDTQLLLEDIRRLAGTSAAKDRSKRLALASSSKWKTEGTSNQRRAAAKRIGSAVGKALVSTFDLLHMPDDSLTPRDVRSVRESLLSASRDLSEGPIIALGVTDLGDDMTWMRSLRGSVVTSDLLFLSLDATWTHGWPDVPSFSTVAPRWSGGYGLQTGLERCIASLLSFITKKRIRCIILTLPSSSSSDSSRSISPWTVTKSLNNAGLAVVQSLLGHVGEVS